MAWTDVQISELLELKKEGLTNNEIGEILGKTENAIRKAYERFKDIGNSDDDFINNLLSKRSAQKRSSKNAKEVRIVLDHLEERETFLEEFKSILKTTKFKIHPKVVKKVKKKNKRTLVAHLSDTHFGANIQPDDVGGINKYTNIEEARRLAYFTKEISEYKLEHRKDTELVVMLNGDLIQGVIHNIDCTIPLTTQFSTVLSLLTQSLSYLANSFNSVKVVCLTDNHARAMHRPEKGRHTQNRWDSYATMFHVGLRYALTSHKNISFEIPTTPYWYGKIQGHNFFVAHSDSVLSTGSIGKSISVSVINSKINDLSSGIGKIDVVMAGHTHIDMKTTLNNGTVLLCNGCMSGIDEYALSLGITKNLPSQQLFEVTEKYAVGDMRTIMLEEADERKELDLIIEPFVGKF